ncbi:MAG: hypothetical protein R3324_02800 [Halobacteriales archaeon]|nr:hypothetical protein [Halobacteriales archaeon]
MREHGRGDLYVEADFILALIQDDDWLRSAAEAVFDAPRDDLWTARDTLIELMMVVYREGWNVEHVVAATHRSESRATPNPSSRRRAPSRRIG